jgi:hypothetical protein
VLLEDYAYSQFAREAVVIHAAEHGTPSGCEHLEAEDEHDAEMAFVEALPAVPYSSPEWGSDDDLDGLDIPPVCGGSEEAEPYEPTAEDLADLAAWSEDLERRRAMVEFYGRHPLAEFNSIRED